MTSKGTRTKIRTKSSYRVGAGFTIIEVLIVLAIAALILIVVFLAIPALQRNSRNAQYNREASRLYAAAQEFLNNNSGTLPAASGSGTAGSDAAKIFALANPKNVSVLTVVASGTVAAQSPTLGATPTDILVSSVKCGAEGGTTITPTATGASLRSLILIYAIENADGTVNAQCNEG
jgi:prepilin-type N-terminal cleavage/methylation domain-containing protein